VPLTEAMFAATTSSVKRLSKTARHRQVFGQQFYDRRQANPDTFPSANQCFGNLCTDLFGTHDKRMSKKRLLVFHRPDIVDHFPSVNDDHAIC